MAPSRRLLPLIIAALLTAAAGCSNDLGAGGSPDAAVDAGSDGGSPDAAMDAGPDGGANDGGRSCLAGLEALPSRITFGVLAPGASETREVNLYNPSTLEACSLLRLALSAASDPAFTLEGGGLEGIDLAPGELLPVEITFSPTARGAAAEGFLVATLAAGGVLSIPLRGRALDLAARVEPRTLDFGPVLAPCARSEAEVCLINEGGLELTLTEVTLSPGGAHRIEVGPVLPIALATGSRACWTITFSPVVEGPARATLLVVAEPGPLTLTVPIAGEGVTSTQVTETFLQTEARKADILWVVDNSGSNREAQALLSLAAPALVDELEQAAIDYRMAVVFAQGTDLAGATAGKMEPQDRSTPHIIHPGLPDPGAVLASNIGSRQSMAFEAGLEAARRALSAPLISQPEINGGFLRPDAYLSIVFVSDEEDQSPDPVATYLSFFLGIHGASRPDLFLASAIVGPPPDGCSSAELGAIGGQRYWDLAAQTGGAQTSVCGLDWLAPIVTTVASVGRVSHFVLGRHSNASGGTQVRIIADDGSRRPATGWLHDPQANAIDFDPTSTPEAGETVEVTYLTACP